MTFGRSGRLRPERTKWEFPKLRGSSTSIDPKIVEHFLSGHPDKEKGPPQFKVTAHVPLAAQLLTYRVLGFSIRLVFYRGQGTVLIIVATGLLGYYPKGPKTQIEGMYPEP